MIDETNSERIREIRSFSSEVGNQKCGSEVRGVRMGRE